MAALRGRTRALVLDSHPHLHSHSHFCSHFCSRFYRPRSRFCSHYRPRSHSHSPSHPSRRCSFFRREIVHPLPQCARPRRPRSLVAIAIAASSPPALPFPRWFLPQCPIPAGRVRVFWFRGESEASALSHGFGSRVLGAGCGRERLPCPALGAWSFSFSPPSHIVRRRHRLRHCHRPTATVPATDPATVICLDPHAFVAVL